MKEKLIIIGIDSMDRELIGNFLEDLPTFKKIIENSPNIKSTSVFPPDSDTAWASIYTGLNPAKHGMVTFVDPLEKASIQETDYLNSYSLQGKTFWDIAGKHGKRVCLIYPHAAYPVWPVNGFIVVPIPKKDGFQIYPSDFKFNFHLDKLEVPKTIPNSKSEYKKYLDKFKEIVIKEFDFGNKMMINYEWDLFLFYSSVLDFIQHVFWNYCDPNDPTYPGDDNQFRNAIRDFYILHDRLIGEMVANVGEKTPILILSDHGHSMRPINLFNTNEVLREEKLLFSKGGAFAPVYGINEQIKRITVDVAQKTGLRRTALSILRMFPKIKDMYTIPSSIDFERTIAHCTDLSGMKSYTYGGIIISKNKLGSKEEYIETKKRIIEKLTNYIDPSSNETVFEWICEREHLYEGTYLEKYPDILFNLKEEYGAGWAINIPVFSKTAAHNFFPGSHHGSTPVFYLLNLRDKKCVRETIKLMDITPTILDLLEIDRKAFDFDGKSIFEK